MKRTLILIILAIALAGCVTQVNTTAQSNNKAPDVNSPPSLLPKFFTWFKLLKG